MAVDARVKAALELLSDALGAGVTGPSFAEVWRRYFREEGRRNDTARDIERRGLLLCAFMDGRQALSFTTEVAEDYRELRRDETRNRDLYAKAGVPFRRVPKPATVNREIECAKRALQWAVEQRPQLIPYNSLATAEPEPENNVRTTRLQTEEEIQRVLDLADPVERAAFLLWIDCGPRRKEVLSLQWDQIFMARDSRDHDQPVIQLWDTKNKDNRRIGISWRAYEAVQALPRVSRYVFPGRVPGSYRGRAAPIRPGKHLGPDAFLRRMKRLFKRAGVEGMVIHDLRHSFIFIASNVYQTPEKATMKQTGHKTVSAWKRYGIDPDEERARLYDKVNQGIEKELERIARKRR